ncbi:NACHT domain-containing protein [Saccharothrix luteola]|uniref:NACHT domain-containing protein n=1 Tax=Saccharothrix luteola TaxID=2893018 RepID=UPI001E373940|nr:NACHT domain-containing protein [Saccharothrix luteola]MCC8243098.1 NACHT domain-containing protein [Saccharothrix luteola]
MRWRWVLTWLLCAVLAAGQVAVWVWAEPEQAADAGSVVAAVVGLFGVLTVWAWRRDPRRGPSTPGQVADAALLLARLVRRQWQDEAALRQLFDPAPLPVRWADCSLPDVGDHRQLIGDPVSCRADAPQELASAFRGLPRRRLVVLGPAGSGKTTFAVLLTLALLRDRDPDEPVPVLLSLASFDPSRESPRTWLRRRIAADYPALADVETFGPTAIDDLLADGRVLPVLDALDERPEPGRAAVLTALDDTLDPHSPVVLTCRTADYTTAVADAGVLTGAAVVTPSPVRPDDAVTLLRLATPPGPRQERWDTLAEHLAEHPDGPTAQALTSPLVVALARTVYADAPGDPTELTDTGRFPTSTSVEHHLLDALVPTLYTRAHRQEAAGRRRHPARAHRHLTHLAAGLRRQGTYDLAWWQLYRWTPTSASPRRRVLLWMSVVALLDFLLGKAYALVPGGGHDLVHDDAVGWLLRAVPGPACVILIAAWLARRARVRSPILTAALSAFGGAAVGACVVTAWDFATGQRNGWGEAVEDVLGRAGTGGVLFVLVILVAGLPVPPAVPSRAGFSTHQWRHRLPGAVRLTGATALVIAAICGVFTFGTGSVTTSVGAASAGFAGGTVIGVGFAFLRWIKNPSGLRDVVTPASSVRADRLLALVAGTVAVLAPVLTDDVPWALIRYVGRDGFDPGTTLRGVVYAFFSSSAACLVVALNASAWAHYTSARLVQAARGRLPWRLQEFLAEAHRLGILRQVGAVYQFRHARLQNHLAARHDHPGDPWAVPTPPLQHAAETRRSTQSG